MFWQYSWEVWSHCMRQFTHALPDTVGEYYCVTFASRHQPNIRWREECCFTLSLPSSKSTFSQPFKEKCTSEVIRIGSIIIFHLSKLWKAKFFILCDIIYLVRLQEKFEIDHSWEWEDYLLGLCLLGNKYFSACTCISHNFFIEQLLFMCIWCSNTEACSVSLLCVVIVLRWSTTFFLGYCYIMQSISLPLKLLNLDPDEYSKLVYTTQVNSAFRAIWLVPQSRDIKCYSLPGGFRRKKMACETHFVRK